ncbi:MAG: hypothetical protein D6775_02545, partial [Caldilineae bacterium]
LAPTVVIGVILARRTRSDQERPGPPAYGQPPIIVVGGGMPANMLPANTQASAGAAPQAMIPAPPVHQPRQFRMMGYEINEAVDLSNEEWSPLD